jgi:hypothetical protein
MARSTLSGRDVLAQIPAATPRARNARLSEPHASSARYDRRRRVLHVALTNGGGFTVPVKLIPDLQHATDRDIAMVTVGAAGVGLRWERLDADLSVAGLARAVLGADALMKAAGAAGGAVRSVAKAEAARRNGKKGGRPGKTASRRRIDKSPV